MRSQKISFKVPPGLWQSFATQTSSLFIARAPFLNHMIARETPKLVADLDGRKLSLPAKRHISGMLKKQGARSVNIEVEEKTASKLNAVVSECNLVRDAFLCRLIIFLRSSDYLLKHLEVPREVGSGRVLGGSLEDMPSSPLKAMEAVRDDPLFYIRHHVNENWKYGIYTVPLPRSLDWAACFLEDKDIPGTKTYKEDQRQTAEAFELLEKDVFAKAPSTKKGRAK